MSQADEQDSRSPGTPSALPRPPTYVGTVGMLLLGAYLFASILVEINLIVEFWPESLEVQASTDTPRAPQVDPPLNENTRPWKKEYCLLFLSGECRVSIGDGTVTDDQRVIILVLLAGGIGGMVHTLRSYVAFAGNRLLARSWIWWYIFRPFEGAILALVFYLVVRAGLAGDISAGSGAFGVVGFSTLVGMFSQQAVTKLKEIAETIFAKPKIKKLPDKLPEDELPDELPEDKLPERVTQPGKTEPKIESLNPAAITRGSESLAIGITGTGFTRDSIARVDGKERSTAYISETELTFTLDPSDVAEAGERKIVVLDSATGSASAALELKVN